MDELPLAIDLESCNARREGYDECARFAVKMMNLTSLSVVQDQIDPSGITEQRTSPIPGERHSGTGALERPRFGLSV
jgi:hypothetical protein